MNKKLEQLGRKTHARLQVVIRRGYDYNIAVLETGGAAIIQTEYEGKPRVGKIHSQYARPMGRFETDQWNLANPKSKAVLKNIRSALIEECVRLWGEV